MLGSECTVTCKNVPVWSLGSCAPAAIDFLKNALAMFKHHWSFRECVFASLSFALVLQRNFPFALEIDATILACLLASFKKHRTVAPILLSTDSLHSLPSPGQLTLSPLLLNFSTLLHLLASPPALLHHEGRPTGRSLRRCCICRSASRRSRW